MAKAKTTIYFCQNCGHESAKWLGQCPGCREWNTFVEELIDKKSAGKAREKAADAAQVVPLSKIVMTDRKSVV